MAKQPNDAAAPKQVSLDAHSTPAERDAVNRAHHTQMAGHLIENAVRAGHGGHMLGRQGGAKGHEMPPSDAHLQSGQYLPQGAFAKVPQNTSSDGAGSANANEPDADDYGRVDK
jgi:hypothetical protein